jgi:spermidine synthase
MIYSCCEQSARRAGRCVLASMFCLGLFSVIGQVTCVREMLVAFFGNELTVGVVLSTWLASISLGAFAARLLLSRIDDADRLRRVLCVLGGCLALLLPLQVQWIRVARSVLGVPAGEYASLHVVFGCAVVAFLPSCAMIGLFFPVACARLAAVTGGGGESGESAVSPASRVYSWEAVGSALGGAALTYLLLPLLSPLRIVAGGSAAGLLIAVLNARGSRGRTVLGLLAAVALASAAIPVLTPVEEASVRARWRAFGVLPDAHAESEAGGARVRFVGHENTVYQNLALFESLGQYALYANGEVMSVFPDAFAYEPDVHFVMAQKPDARRVLLLGGNPVGEVPELLKYPLEALVHVEIDPGVGRLVRSAVPGVFDAAVRDRRLQRVTGDAARYIMTCRETFDVVLVRAPSPSTAGANRFYTREFFQAVKRMLSPGGFVQTSVTSSVRLQDEAAELGASVYRALKSVFPVVLVTAGEDNVLLAGDAGLTFDRQTLFERSRAVGIANQCFRPEYFLGSDDIDPDKCSYVVKRFESVNVRANTILRPSTYLHQLVLWSRYSESGVGPVLRRLQGPELPFRICSVVTYGIGALLFVSAAIAVWQRGGGGSGLGRGWARVQIAVLIGTTGFCGMAIEMLLVLVFQGLYGYIYTRIGLIVAMFMLGLVAGAPSGRWMAGKGGRMPWLLMGAVELLLAVFPFAIILLVHAAALPAGSTSLLRALEAAVYGCVVVAGWAVGAEFPLGNRLLMDAGGSVGAAAAVTDASDHCGAALGSLLVGVLLVPVFGLRAACLALIAVKVVGLTLLCGAFICASSRSSQLAIRNRPSATD